MFGKFIIPVLAFGLVAVGSKYLYSIYKDNNYDNNKCMDEDNDNNNNQEINDEENQVDKDLNNEQLDNSINVNQIEDESLLEVPQPLPSSTFNGNLLAEAFTFDGIIFFTLVRIQTSSEEENNQLYYYEGFLISGAINGQYIDYSFNLKVHPAIPRHVMENYIVVKARRAFKHPELIPKFEQLIYEEYGVQWSLDFMIDKLRELNDVLESQV